MMTAKMVSFINILYNKNLAVKMMWCIVQSDKDSREDIQKVFNLFDDDQTGKISLRNLKRVAKELGETMSDAELLEMIERADTDTDGEINFGKLESCTFSNVII